MSKKHFRDAESGEFVSEEYAAEHAATTVGEGPGGLSHLIKVLKEDGGAIVRAKDLSADDIAIAKQAGWYDNGVVYVPIQNGE